MQVMKYSQTWNYFYDEKKRKSFRVPPGDLRGTHQWCVANCAADENYPEDLLPIAPPITDREKQAIEEAHRAIWCRPTPKA